MNTHCQASTQSPAHALCFRSLFREGRGRAFPCDPQGRVDMDGLSDTARANYLYARAVIGREYAWPSIESRLRA